MSFVGGTLSKRHKKALVNILVLKGRAHTGAGYKLKKTNRSSESFYIYSWVVLIN